MTTVDPVTPRAPMAGLTVLTCAPARIVNERLTSPPSGEPFASRAPTTLTAYRVPGVSRPSGTNHIVVPSQRKRPVTAGVMRNACSVAR